MASIYKRNYTRPIPPGASIITRKGQRMARYTDSRGRTQTVPLTPDGSMLLLTRRCWYIAYNTPVGRRVARGFTDREATEALAKTLIQQDERKQAGLISVDPAKLSAPIGPLIKLYAQDLEAAGRDDKYVANCRNRLGKIAEDCSWPTPASIRMEDVTRWRQLPENRAKAPRTINQYIETLNAFVGFCISHGYLAGNPINNIAKADESDKRRLRRALDLTQLRQLLAVSGKRWLIYLVAMKTGLRRDELQKLQWGDVHLGDGRPRIHFRGTANKARREDTIPLDAELVEHLTAHKPAEAKASDCVFASVPRIETYKRDLARAGIAYKDDQGRQADFHSLRMSYNMLLAAAGVPIRVAMDLMRHTDIKLTAKNYTDPKMLDMGGAVEKLPRLTEPT